jgi:HAMP domain-containing protein
MSNSDSGPNAAQTADLLATLDALRTGDFSARVAFDGFDDADAVAVDAASTVNALADQIQNFALHASRLVHATCVDGRLGEQIEDFEGEGDWQTLVENLNNMNLILATQIRDIGRVAATVAEGDLSQKVAVAAQGEMAEIKDTFNAMIDQLQLLKDSVTRMMQRVSTLGAVPGQATADQKHTQLSDGAATQENLQLPGDGNQS